MDDRPMLILQTLTRHGVPFVVIGGHAVAVHGFPRATEDTDIVFVRTPESESALLAALSELHAEWISDERDPQTGLERRHPVTLPFIQTRATMWLITESGFLDVFDHVPGLPDAGAQDLLAESCVVHGIPYASREWLLRMKRATGRKRDQIDIEELEKP